MIIKAVHVEDYDAMDELISDVDKDRPLDLVIANAGIANTDKTITPKIVWSAKGAVSRSTVYGHI